MFWTSGLKWMVDDVVHTIHVGQNHPITAEDLGHFL